LSNDFTEQHKIETYKSLLSISDAAFKYLGVLNGGTWLSALVFAKDLPGGQQALMHASRGIEFFVISLVLTGLCYLGAYMTQLALHNENIDHRFVRHEIPLWITVLVFIAAVGTYGWGATQVRMAFFG